MSFKPALLEQKFSVSSLAMKTQLTWYGQSAFKIVSPAGKVLLIDPWLTNPVYDRGKDDFSSLNNVDLILVSHGHSDHVGNAVEIGKKTRAKLVDLRFVRGDGRGSGLPEANSLITIRPAILVARSIY